MKQFPIGNFLSVVSAVAVTALLCIGYTPAEDCKTGRCTPTYESPKSESKKPQPKPEAELDDAEIIIVDKYSLPGVGTITIFDNGTKRWAEHERPFVYTYNFGQVQKIEMPYDAQEPVLVKTKRYGTVFGDPTLLANR